MCFYRLCINVVYEMTKLIQGYLLWCRRLFSFYFFILPYLYYNVQTFLSSGTFIWLVTERKTKYTYMCIYTSLQNEKRIYTSYLFIYIFIKNKKVTELTLLAAIYIIMYKLFSVQELSYDWSQNEKKVYIYVHIYVVTERKENLYVLSVHLLFIYL
jgi:hypothetical protein